MLYLSTPYYCISYSYEHLRFDSNSNSKVFLLAWRHFSVGFAGPTKNLFRAKQFSTFSACLDRGTLHCAVLFLNFLRCFLAVNIERLHCFQHKAQLFIFVWRLRFRTPMCNTVSSEQFYSCTVMTQLYTQNHFPICISRSSLWNHS